MAATISWLSAAAAYDPGVGDRLCGIAGLLRAAAMPLKTLVSAAGGLAAGGLAAGGRWCPTGRRVGDAGESRGARSAQDGLAVG